MRRRLALLLCLTLVSLVGCELRGRLFNIEIPNNSISTLPVGLHDVTDLVTAIDVGELTGPGVEPEFIAVSSIAGEPNALKVDWMGGACVGSIHVDFTREGQGFVLALDELKSLGGMVGCPGVGVFRSLVLRLTQPLQPENVRHDYTLS